MKELFEYVVNFMSENEITCPEDIVQSDKMQHKLENFMCECFELVKSELETD